MENKQLEKLLRLCEEVLENGIDLEAELRRLIAGAKGF